MLMEAIFDTNPSRVEMRSWMNMHLMVAKQGQTISITPGVQEALSVALLNTKRITPDYHIHSHHV